jgi:hypothetical protein
MKTYDLRTFFGGMGMYHDSAGMAHILKVPFAERMTTDFVHGVNGDADPIMLPSKLAGASSSDTEFCISLRVWDLLLWFAIMGRPRRDVGIMSDFAKVSSNFYTSSMIPSCMLARFLHCKNLRICHRHWPNSAFSFSRGVFFLMRLLR